MKECQNCNDYIAYYTKEHGIYKKKNLGQCKRLGRLVGGSELCYCWNSIPKESRNVKN